MFTAVDCQGFAGGFALGVTQAGFALTAKREAVNFGIGALEANRHLLGNDFRSEVRDPSDWTPVKADLVFGNPPCSGFSMSSNWGSEASRLKVNQCMVDFIGYASKCDADVVVMESVPRAWTLGRSWIEQLQEQLNTESGRHYDLMPVLHNSLDLGGVQFRPRFFAVFHRIPFTAPEPLGVTVTTAERLHNAPADVTRETPRINALRKLAESGAWLPGEKSFVAHARRPDIDIPLGDRVKHGWVPKRMTPEGPCPVVQGTAMDMLWHWSEPRPVTYRETARLMGLPDDWDVEPYKAKATNATWFGKGVTVEAASWIAIAVRQALEGSS